MQVDEKQTDRLREVRVRVTGREREIQSVEREREITSETKGKSGRTKKDKIILH